MKLEKDNALERATVCEGQARDANIRAEKVRGGRELHCLWLSPNRHLSFMSLIIGWGGGSWSAEEDPDRWERLGPDPGGSHAGQRQAGGEEQEPSEREYQCRCSGSGWEWWYGIYRPWTAEFDSGTGKCIFIDDASLGMWQNNRMMGWVGMWPGIYSTTT